MQARAFIYKDKDEKGADVYLSSLGVEGTYNHMRFFGPIPHGLADEIVILDDSLLRTLLHENELFETADEIIVLGADGAPVHYTKESLFKKAAELLCDQADRDQQLMGFSHMSSSQRRIICAYLVHLLGNIDKEPQVIRLPVIATYNYIQNPHYDVDDMPTHVSIKVVSDTWNDVLENLSCTLSPIIGNLSAIWSFSYFVKLHSSL